MALKKTELYSTLWKSCDELRGGMDATQYKYYVLTLLFLKYISDKAGQDNGSLIDIPAGCTFADIAALKNDKEIGDKLNQIIAKIAAANDLQGVIDQTDFNDSDKLGSGKDMVDRLSNLVGNFEMLDLAGNKADGDDLLGDAYEYLMRHFATESGKSKGQFYTPAEVSRLMAKIIGIPANAPRSTTVYDPTCGSGSLLLKAGGEAEGGLSIYGQENDNATVALAKMNMILHGEPTAEIKQGNTIASPKFLTGGALKTFDFAVANPPFSNKNWMNGIVPHNDIHRPARKKRRLRLFAAHRQKPQIRRQRRSDSAARRTLSRQRRGAHPRKPAQTRHYQRHHRTARQPLLRHRHPRLHHRHRQSGRHPRRLRPRGQPHQRPRRIYD